MMKRAAAAALNLSAKEAETLEVAPMSVRDVSDDILRAFREYDADGNGVIDAFELGPALQGMGLDVEAAAKSEVAALIARSRAAQAEIEHYTQEQVDDLITAMVYSVCQEDTAKMIAQHTVDETQLGNYDGKFLKIHRKTRAALQDIIDDKSVGVIEELLGMVLG